MKKKFYLVLVFFLKLEYLPMFLFLKETFDNPSLHKKGQIFLTRRKTKWKDMRLIKL